MFHLNEGAFHSISRGRCSFRRLLHVQKITWSEIRMWLGRPICLPIVIGVVLCILGGERKSKESVGFLSGWMPLGSRPHSCLTRSSRSGLSEFWSCTEANRLSEQRARPCYSTPTSRTRLALVGLLSVDLPVVFLCSSSKPLLKEGPSLPCTMERAGQWNNTDSLSLAT